MKWIRETLEMRWQLLVQLGREASAPGGESPQGKRQNRFETEAVWSTNYSAIKSQSDVQIEGYPYDPATTPHPSWTVYDDPQGGTVGFSRGIDAGGSVTDLSVGSLLLVQENGPYPTFGSLKYAGNLDLRNGAIYLSDGKTAFRIKPGMEPEKLVTKPMYNRHYPVIGTENTRRANSFWSFLIGHPLYPQVVGDSHSTLAMFLDTALGVIDFTVNANLPGIMGGGNRGDDLGAAAVFFRAMGAYAVQVQAWGNRIAVVGSLDNAPYSFDGQTQVVLAPTEAIANHYLARINRSLLSPVGDHGQCVADVLAVLYNTSVPDERWRLPVVDDGTK